MIRFEAPSASTSHMRTAINADWAVGGDSDAQLRESENLKSLIERRRCEGQCLLIFGSLVGGEVRLS